MFAWFIYDPSPMYNTTHGAGMPESFSVCNCLTLTSQVFVNEKATRNCGLILGWTVFNLAMHPVQN